MLKHVVMVKIKEDCDVRHCCILLEGLMQHVPAVRSVTWGSNAVTTTSSFDFCFIVEFDDLDGLTAYDTSDYHQLLRQEIRSIRKVSHSIDFFDPF